MTANNNNSDACAVMSPSVREPSFTSSTLLHHAHMIRSVLSRSPFSSPLTRINTPSTPTAATTTTPSSWLSFSHRPSYRLTPTHSLRPPPRRTYSTSLCLRFTSPRLHHFTSLRVITSTAFTMPSTPKSKKRATLDNADFTTKAAETDVSAPKLKRAKTLEAPPSETKKAGAKKKSDSDPPRLNPTLSEINLEPITDDDSKWFKIATWNVNGMAAITKKGSLTRYIEQDSPDVLCLQETKTNEDKQVSKSIPKGYKSYFNHCKVKKGYSGTAFICKEDHVPLKVTYGIGMEKHDGEGRCITAEYKTFYLVNVYVPNSGQKLERLAYRQTWDKDMLAYLVNLQEKKPVVFLGDLNVAHYDLDLKNPKTNKKSAGWQPEERQGLTTYLTPIKGSGGVKVGTGNAATIVKEGGGGGLVDVWRERNKGTQEFTYWSYRFNSRAKGTGWRIDYFLVSDGLKKKVKDCVIRGTELGSDHCPSVLLLPLECV